MMRRNRRRAVSPACAAFVVTIIIAIIAIPQAQAADPPPDLAKRVSRRESEAAKERAQYAYTQSMRLQELDGRGAEAGEYHETREIIFSPGGDRTERFVGEPVSRLKRLILTPEDFADLRDIQPFVMTEDQIWNYDADYKGEEPVDGIDCFVLRIQPKHILSGQRLFDGMLWVKEDDFSVVRSEGQAVPQIITTRQENLFPRFTTIRRQVNGSWFPAVTSADDTLHFRTGPIREKLTIHYNDYRRFGSETTIRFDQ
jgi:hypothetical protein